MHETRTLAQFVAQIQYADLPPSLIDEGKILVAGPRARSR